ncbi:spore germination protein, partial [Paenibacillus massiliensis]
PMVIVVSITGIASFIIPHFELSLTLRLLRFPILILGGTLGLIGIVMSLFITYWYMVNLRSFGIPYMQPLAPFVFQDLKDTLLRVPWFDMKRRPSSFTNTNQLKRRSSK